MHYWQKKILLMLVEHVIVNLLYLVCLLSFLSFGSAIWFLFFRNETAYLVYSAVGAVIFGYYLVLR